MPLPSDLRLVDVGKTFGRHKVLRHVDLDIPAGSFVALMGANGAGKTTLLRLVAGLATPTTGAVTLAGVDLRNAGPGLRRMLGFVSHDGLLYGDLTGRQNLMFHARLFGVADPEARIEELADVLDLRRVLDRPAGVLSRGNKQRLTLARALMHGPDVLLLDEPFTGLDEESAGRLVQLLRALHAEGRTIVMTVHEMSRALEGPTRLVVMGDGGIAVDEPIEAVNVFAEELESELVGVATEHGAGSGHAGRAPGSRPGLPERPDLDEPHAAALTARPALVVPPGRFRSASLITAKDLRVELRSRDVLMSSGLFAITVLITASFTTVQTGNTGSMATGILWISLLFAVLLGVGRSMARESQDRAIEGLLLSPAPRESIFLGKLLAGLVTMGLIEVFIVPMFLVLMTGESQGALDVGSLVVVVLLATLGLTIVATLFSGIAVGSRMGESLLPLIVMPVVIPLMIAAVETTRLALGGDASGSVNMIQWYALLAGFDLVVGLAAIATFSFVVEDS
ncbi:MAG: heme exporter protein CcmB [Actinomycetales bacterium]|nr:heme exporter protein CcmB [Actinomycetales bacterium]